MISFLPSSKGPWAGGKKVASERQSWAEVGNMCKVQTLPPLEGTKVPEYWPCRDQSKERAA